MLFSTNFFGKRFCCRTDHFEIADYRILHVVLVTYNHQLTD